MNEMRGSENEPIQPAEPTVEPWSAAPPAPAQAPEPVAAPGYEFVPTGPHAAIHDALQPVVPVQPLGAGRSHRFRWAIAGAIVLVVALVTAAGAFVLSGAAGSKSLTASAAPKTSVMFLELRTDLPGDQHQKLADFMTHFPGFADRAQFDSALDEIFNRVTRVVSPDLAYTSAFKPWMEGEVSVAVLPMDANDLKGLQMGPSMMTSGAMPSLMDALVIVALKNRDAAQTWISGELSNRHMATTSQTYAGETLYTLTASASDSYALTSSNLLIGTTSAVKAALDTKTAGSLADDATYKEAMGSISGDSLARFYMNPKSMAGSMTKLFSSLSTGLGMNLAGTTLDKLPSWIAGAVRAESDRIVLEEHAPRTEAALSENHASVIANNLPGDTVAVFEAHSVGKALSKAIDQFKAAAPSLGIKSDQLTQVEQAIGLVGVDWVDDVAVAVTDKNETVGGGIVIQTPDASTASSKVALLSNLVALGGGQLGVSSKVESYKDHSITVLSMKNSSPGGGAAQIGVTTKDNLIVVGYGDTFAKDVLDATSSTALSAQSDYGAVMSAVGSSNQASAYVNIPAIKDQLGKMAVNSASWNLNYKPYFDHLGGFGYASVDGSMSTVRLVLMAR